MLYKIVFKNREKTININILDRSICLSCKNEIKMFTFKHNQKNSSFLCHLCFESQKLKKDEEIIIFEAANPIRAKKCYWFKERRYKAKLKPRKN